MKITEEDNLIYNLTNFLSSRGDIYDGIYNDSKAKARDTMNISKRIRNNKKIKMPPRANRKSG